MDANEPTEDYDVDGLDDDDLDPDNQGDNKGNNQSNQGDNDDFENEPGQYYGNDVDQEDAEGRQLDQIFSEGFTAAEINEDPCKQFHAIFLESLIYIYALFSHNELFQTKVKAQSGSASQRAVQKGKIDPSQFIPGPTDNEVNDERLGESSKSETISKNKKHKSTMYKGKPFKVLKAPKASSASEDALDPEEEKLKMLPDCCEFTARRNDAYETDESRKEMSSEWFSQIKLS